ncbi:hypothetical protein [Actinomadura madurae]|uniref:hypothetical protein n=1 Tax=Actinomadura madurae TaxID=1993 RepID=UPI0020D23ADE|nr:hypothetical protein [Actinomadura madurae]MCP9947227.1 hypothetical protein [Actinomadura madurae]MCP9963992.1 hypothetical protein [Actinomadura madurae]MCP9976467.1 hypothetical protein [Actinomadura madurae]MCQ0012039.1 hypothetical protein [Actinomadura madurae]MCQ0012660.1 hypothetical protein [Actinomadura madurae]
MPDFTIPASPALLDDRSNVGGGFCPLCKAGADHGTGHACITQPGPIDAALIALPDDAATWVLARLAAHPARPLNEMGERRGVDTTWCVCGCTTDKKDTER